MCVATTNNNDADGMRTDREEIEQITLATAKSIADWTEAALVSAGSVSLIQHPALSHL